MKNKNFLIAQYENWTAVLRRIKQDELKWISLLFLMYGAIYTFQLSKTENTLNLENNELFGLVLIFLVNSIVVFIWCHQSLNLRLQYYRALIESIKIRLRFDESIEKIWFKDCFCTWRKKVTRPFETKIVDFILLSGLILVSSILSIYKYLYLKLDKFSDIVIIIVCIFYLALIAYPLFYYSIADKRKLKKIYKEKKLPLRKHSA